MKNKKLLILVPALMLTFGGLATLSSCGPTPTPGPVLVDSITVSPNEVTLVPGDTQALTATVLPENAENTGVTWTTSSSDVATVSARGTVTAVAEGSAVITATAKDGSGKFATCAVTVEDQKGRDIDNPLTVAEALAIIADLDEGGETSSVYYVAGKVKAITGAYSAQYGNISFTMVDNLTDTAVFTAYRVACTETLGNAVKLESDVVVSGILMNYQGTTPETKQGTGTLHSATGGQQDLPEPAHQSKTLAEIIAADASLNKKVAYETTAFIKYFGKAEGTNKDQYGNATLTDNEGNDIYSYGMTAESTALAWSGAAGEYGYTNPKTFETNEVTKDLKPGAELELLVIRNDYQGTKQLNTIITRVINNPVQELTEVTLGPSSAYVTVGETLTLTVTPNEGAIVALTDFNWETSNEEVATVANGVVTGVAEGTATITATHKEKTTITATLDVTVETSTVINYGTESEPITVAEALQIADRLLSEVDSYTPEMLWVRAVVTNVPTVNGTYGWKNIDLADADALETTLLAYSVNKSATCATLAQNDVVTINGALKNYGGTIEFTNVKVGTETIHGYPTFSNRVAGTSTISVDVEHATVSEVATSATNDTVIEFTVTPETGYRVTSVKVYGNTLTADATDKYSFTLAGNATVVITTVSDSTPEPTYVDATMTAGTQGSAAVVVVNGVNKDAIKVGTSSKAGDMTITVPSTATHVRFYGAAWNGKSAALTISATNATVSSTSLNLVSDTGINNNSPFTLAGTEETYLCELDVSNATGEVTIKLETTSTSNGRFVVWGAQYC